MLLMFTLYELHLRLLCVEATVEVNEPASPSTFNPRLSWLPVFFLVFFLFDVHIYDDYDSGGGNYNYFWCFSSIRCTEAEESG